MREGKGGGEGRGEGGGNLSNVWHEVVGGTIG